MAVDSDDEFDVDTFDKNYDKYDDDFYEIPIDEYLK